MKKVRKTILSMVCAVCALAIIGCKATVTGNNHGDNLNNEEHNTATVVKMSELEAYIASLEPNTPDEPYEICISEPDFKEVGNLISKDWKKYFSLSFSNYKSIESFGYQFDFMCPNLQKIIIPYGVKIISGFQRMGKIDIIIPDTIQKIKEHALADIHTDKLSLPEGLTAIGDWAFEYSEIKILILPKSLTSIGWNSITSNTVQQIKYAGSEEDWAKIEKTESDFEGIDIIFNYTEE